MKVILVKAKTLAVFAFFFAVFFGIFSVAGAVSAYAVSALTKNRLIPVYSVETDEKKIAISFDCAWGVEYTDTILEELKRADVKCTFFAVEFWVEKHPEYAKKIVEQGHELGTHSKTHPYMTKLSRAEIKNELVSSSKAIEKAVGVYPTLFRAPYGDYNDTVVSEATANGLYTIQWDVDSLDWKNISANDIALRIVNKVKNGSIILCHNNGLHTAEALPMVFSTLQNRGYKFVPISELIYKENYTVDSFGRQHTEN